MRLNDVQDFYGTSYRFKQVTGMSHALWNSWRKKGYVPIKAQIKLEELTEGRLKASLEDLDQKNVVECKDDDGTLEIMRKITSMMLARKAK